MEEFKERIKKALQEVLGDSYEIAETEVTKLNDCKHPTLVVREKESLVGATVYLDNFVSKDMNKEYLKDKVYVDYIDLAVIFCVLLSNNHSSHATAVVSKRLSKSNQSNKFKKSTEKLKKIK